MGRLKQAESQFRILGDDSSRAATLGDIARILVSKGEVDEALRLHEEELAVHRRLNDADGIANAQWDLAQLDLNRHDLLSALKRLDEAWSILSRIDRVEGLAVVGSTYGEVMAMQGQHDQARKVLAVAIQCWRKLGRINEAIRVEAILAIQHEVNFSTWSGL
jgi:tetratricopeptide (TPR) repeat protein